MNLYLWSVCKTSLSYSCTLCSDSSSLVTVQACFTIMNKLTNPLFCWQCDACDSVTNEYGIRSCKNNTYMQCYNFCRNYSHLLCSIVLQQWWCNNSTMRPKPQQLDALCLTEAEESITTQFGQAHGTLPSIRCVLLKQLCIH